MEKDFGSWFYHHHSDRPSLNLNTLCGPSNLGNQNAIPYYMSPFANVVSANATLPGFPFSGVPQIKVSQPIEPHGRFYGLPHFHQAFAPVPNSNFKERIPDGPYKNCEEVIRPNPASECAQKRYLVFDQSGDQTTLIFSSGIGAPVQCPAPWGSKLNSAYDLKKIELETGRDTIHCPKPILTDECNENHRDDVGSEMHEDTEELNALLYSDDDEDGDYSEDDEEASTGHSPSTMTAYDKEEWFQESAEEVASSAGPTKRMKLFHGGYDVPSLMDTAASSVKPKRCFDYEDDAESSCADGKIKGFEESSSLLGNKRSRKDTIRETVSVLQNIIPEVKGKDAIVILDEAIHYLRSLKHKAKALGVDTL